MERRRLRIQLTGPSGIGKTTIAKAISEKYHIPFISGSYSDLVPETKVLSHKEMIQKTPKDIFNQDFQLLNLRNKLFQGQDLYVSDRSFIDSAAYIINKTSFDIPECDMENFIEICKACLFKHCDGLIFMTYPDHIKDWEMEDNHKRVINRYYQMQISQVIWGLLRECNWNYIRTVEGEGLLSTIELSSPGNSLSRIPVCIVQATEFSKRMGLIDIFLHRFDLISNPATLF